MRIEEIVLASTNRGKLAELRAMLAERGGRVGSVRMRGLDEFAPVAPAVEDGPTLEENARAKALYYSRILGRYVLADDSGLEVDALGGAPGVHSARFAAPVPGDRAAQDRANNRRLLGLLAGTPPDRRGARFRCCLCLAGPQGILLEAQGRLEGVIAAAEQGSNGFGYDPVFWAPQRGKTVALLAAAEKNAISHRGRALRALGEKLEALLATEGGGSGGR